MSEETLKNSEKQQVVGIPFTKNDPRINKDGRPPDTEEKKIIKKVMKELVKDYKEKLADALPLIEPVLTAKAIGGDIQAIKELHDRVMGKPEQQTDITTAGKPLYLPTELLNKNDIPPSSTEQDSQ